MLLFYVTLLHNFQCIFCQSGDTDVASVNLGPRYIEIENHAGNTNAPTGNLEENICGEIPGCLDNATNGLEVDKKIILILDNLPNIFILLVLCILTQIATFITLIKVMFCSAKKVRYHIGKRRASIVREEEHQLKPNETYL